MTSHEETSEQLKANVLARMKKISGQLKGVTGMIEAGKDCEDILTQVKAVRSSLKSMKTMMVRLYLLTCNHEMQNKTPQEQQQQLEQIVTVLSRFMD